MKSLSDPEVRWIERLEQHVKRATSLTKWEKGFCDDLFDRFGKFKEHTSISAKQWGIINRITDKVIR